jgi:hypothetical protein
MTDTVTSQNSDLSSYDTMYVWCFFVNQFLSWKTILWNEECAYCIASMSELEKGLSRLKKVCDDGLQRSELLGLWTSSILRYSEKLENTVLRKYGLFLSSGEGGKTPVLLGPLERANRVQCLRLALSKGPNRVGVSPSPEDENRPNFRSVVFSSFSEHRTMNKVKKASNSKKGLVDPCPKRGLAVQWAYVSFFPLGLLVCSGINSQTTGSSKCCIRIWI